MRKYCYITNISKYNFYDIYIAELSLLFDEEGHTIDITTADSKEWGNPSPLVVLTSEVFPLPNKLKMKWVAISENKKYDISMPLDRPKGELLWEKQKLTFPEDPFRQYIVGIGPYGGVAIWLCNNNRSVLVQWLQAKGEIALRDNDAFFSNEMESFKKVGMTPERLQSNMRQYQYRFVPLEEFFDGQQWQRYANEDKLYEDIALDSVEVKRLDGTFDYTGNDNILQFHEAGKPLRIMVRWHENNDSFFAHFWLDEAVVTSVFDSFFKDFPEANADLLLRIDTVANKYEVALSCEGQPARVIDNTQYLVSRNFMEVSRSDNYSKKDGEWRWM